MSNCIRSSRCLACDKPFNDEEILVADDLCRKCLRATYGDDQYDFKTFGDDYLEDQEDE